MKDFSEFGFLNCNEWEATPIAEFDGKATIRTKTHAEYGDYRTCVFVAPDGKKYCGLLSKHCSLPDGEHSRHITLLKITRGSEVAKPRVMVE